MNQSSILEDVDLLETFEANSQKLEEAFKYLHKLSDISRIKNDKTTPKIFLYLNKISKSEIFANCLVNYNLTKKYKIYKLFTDILSDCFKEAKEYLITNEFLEDYSYDSTIKDLKIIFYFLFYSIDVILYLIEFSEYFYSKFHKAGGTSQLFKILKDDVFIQRCLVLKSDSKIQAKIGVDLVQKFTLCVKNLSKLADDNKSEWTQMRATYDLIHFLDIIQTYPNILIPTYMTICNVINEKEIELFSNINSLIKQLIELISIIASSLVNKKEIRKFFDLKNGTKNEICYINYHNNTVNLIEILDSLNHIAVNDTMKYKIYQESNFSNCLKKIILHGNDFEKQYATRLLWQLSFDHDVCKKIYEDDELVKYLDDLNQVSLENKLLKENIFGIFWLSKIFSINSSIINKRDKKEALNSNLLSEFKKKSQTLLKNKNQNETKKDHIMISYNRESRDICLKIKEELEKEGHNIWIDVQDISGSSLESMALAIENSKCVLICMTEKYKQSPNCRAEAEYSFNLRKPIIPLIMQQNYNPDGWLGIILGTKVYINFSKYEFKECITKLKNEIKNLINNDSNNNNVQINSTQNAIKLKLKDWTNQALIITIKYLKDVNTWLKEKQINPGLISMLSMFNGELLVQLSKILKNSPEFYYSSLTNRGQIDLHSIVLFTYEFEKLLSLV